MRRLPLCLNLTLILSLIFIIPAFAGSTTLTTYYPSPSGNYESLSVNNFVVGAASVGTKETACTNAATLHQKYGGTKLYLDSVSGNIQACDSNEQIVPKMNWEYSDNPPSIYTATEFFTKVGINTDTPQHILDLGAHPDDDSDIRLAVFNDGANVSGLGGSATGLDLYAGPTIIGGNPAPAKVTIKDTGSFLINQGNLGIGTAAPSYNVDVVAAGVLTAARLGNVYVLSGPNASGVGFNASRTATGYATTTGVYSGTVEQNPSTGVVAIRSTANTAGSALIDRFTVSPNGNIGVAGPIDPLTNDANGKPVLNVNGGMVTSGLVDVRQGGILVPSGNNGNPPAVCYDKNGNLMNGCLWIK